MIFLRIILLLISLLSAFCFIVINNEIALNRLIRVSTRCYSSGGDSSDDYDDEEDVQPYGNRTLHWTKRYRRLVPYEAARRTAMRLGLRSKEEWEDIRQFGKAFHGAHAVSRPDLMYAKEWISWDEFLGVMRPYAEAKYMVKILDIRNMEDYQAFVKNDTKRAEGLRIPAKPDIVYRNQGWEGPEAFFGLHN